MMKKAAIFYAFVLAAGLAGCQSVGAPQTDSMLSSAGFNVKKADTPAKLAKLKALTQNKMTIQSRNGVNYWVYADAAGCQCVYVGDAIAYQKYQNSRIAQKIEVDRAAAEINQEAMLDWDTFGPYQPQSF
jgi:hypothetical protein